MSAVKAEDVKRGIAVIWENLQCPICLDLMSEPVSTRCDHHFCRFCINKLLERNKRRETSCPVCKTKVTKRSLQESQSFQKLVEGLQNLVRSYEFDTHTNYFTGLPQRRQGASIETESRDQQGSGENTTSEGDLTEKEATLSSTAAAKEAFAKLMCLEDLCPATTEQDCLDSSVGDLPQKPKIKAADPEDVSPRPNARNSQTLQDVTPDDGKHLRRRSKRLCLETDRIMDKRQKKSVQKVSEWLLKISPTSDTETGVDTEGVLPIVADSDAEKESTASCASTEIHASANDKAGSSPEREVPCRGLEEQVFGAVYKRERKIVKITKSFSPERVPFGSGNVSEMDEKIKMPKRRSSRRLTPADFIRKMANEDKEDGVHQEEADEGSKQENRSKPLRSSDKQENVVQCGPDQNAENSPALDVPLKKSGRRSKIQEVWQDVDHVLTEKENTDKKKDRKRRITWSSRDATKDDNLEKGKNAKYAKSLALVSAGTEIVDLREKVPSNPQLIETEVNIESYPSSAEPKSPDARKTRRSLRLQEFTIEVQGQPRRRQSKQAPPKPADGPENNPPTILDEPSAMTDHAGTSQPNASQSEKPELSLGRNGCVYNDDFENIEIVQSSKDAAVPECVSEGTTAEENSLLSVVPDTVDQDKHVVLCSTKVGNSTSPLAALVPEFLPQKLQESPSAKTLIPAIKHRNTEQEEDTNDSELDTEQLMRTFKATKRRSFHLGSPKNSHSRTQDKSLTRILEVDKPESLDQEEVPGISLDCDQVPPSNPCELAPQEITSQSCIEDVASVGLLQVKAPALPSLPEHTQKDKSTETLGPKDLPEKVAKSQDFSRSQDSRPPVNVELPNSVQLFSTSVTQQEPQISLSKDAAKSSEILGKQLQANVVIDSNKISSIANSETGCNNFESSVTPDGLVPNGPEALVIEPATTQNVDKINEGEILSQTCLRRKRKAQRLESSDSESSVENDDLPALAQIFKFHQSSSDPVKNSLNQDGLQAEEQSPKSGLDPISHNSHFCSEPEAQSSPASQCVTSYQKEKSLKDVNSNNVQDDLNPEPPCRDEWVTSSQGSVDLFGTPQECEEVFDGVCGNTGLSINSSQYSSEMITTQQREEMQQELHRLERMMALVSEALQKKDGDLDDKNKMEDNNQHSGQRGRLRSQRSCNGGRQPSQRSEVKGQRVVPEDSTVDMMAEREQNAPRGESLGERSLKMARRAESGGRMELVVSGLSATEQGLVKKFARKMKAGVSSHVTPATSHIIIKTDADLVCERTLKYFQGIAGRKWLVSFLWISECFKHGKLLAEAPYEVCGDVVNGRDHNGPRKARTAPDNDLLMKGCEICFQGSFTDMTTDQMEVIVELCGATVMKDPLMFSRKGNRYQLVVVQPGPDDSQSYYTALQKKATVVSRSWLLDSVAMYTLQNPCDYKP